MFDKVSTQLDNDKTFDEFTDILNDFNEKVTIYTAKDLKDKLVSLKEQQATLQQTWGSDSPIIGQGGLQHTALYSDAKIHREHPELKIFTDFATEREQLPRDYARVGYQLDSQRTKDLLAVQDVASPLGAMLEKLIS